MIRRFGVLAEILQGALAVAMILFVSGGMMYFVVRGPLTGLGQIMFEAGLYGTVALIVAAGLFLVLGILAAPLVAARIARQRRGRRRA